MIVLHQLYRVLHNGFEIAQTDSEAEAKIFIAMQDNPNEYSYIPVYAKPAAPALVIHIVLD